MITALRTLGIDGVSIELRAGWDGYARWLGSHRTALDGEQALR